MTTPSTRKRARWIFGAWAAAMLVCGSSLMASHLAALPTPAPTDARVIRELGRDGHGWNVVHVLASGCGCSRQVVDHIARRGPLPGVHERVLWISKSGARPPGDLRSFPIEVIPPSMLTDRVGVVGAPTMIVAGPDGTVRYLGGYTRQKQSPVIPDTDIISRLQRGEAVAPLPVLGCATDKKTAERYDPFRLR